MSSLDNFDDDLADLDLSEFDTDESALSVEGVEETSTVSGNSLQFFKNIPVEITVEVAQKTLPLAELMDIGPNSVLMLDKHEGEPVDIKVNGKLFGQGEIVEQDNRYGVKIVHVFESFEE